MMDTSGFESFAKTISARRPAGIDTSAFKSFATAVSARRLSVIDTSRFESFATAIADARVARPLADTATFDGFVHALRNLSFDVALIDSRVFTSSADASDDIHGLDRPPTSAADADRLNSLTHRIAEELGDAVLGVSIDAASAVSSREITDAALAVPIAGLGNREWVFVVALAEVVRQLALEQSGVTDAQAALIMLAAIWLLGSACARDKRRRT